MLHRRWTVSGADAPVAGDWDGREPVPRRAQLLVPEDPLVGVPVELVHGVHCGIIITVDTTTDDQEGF